MIEDTDGHRDEIVKTDTMAIPGGLLPVELHEYRLRDGDEDSHGFYITVDGVEWCDCDAEHHALILFEMIRKHATEYMHYEITS